MGAFSTRQERPSPQSVEVVFRGIKQGTHKHIGCVTLQQDLQGTHKTCVINGVN